jgi:hypothetical protein
VYASPLHVAALLTPRPRPFPPIPALLLCQAEIEPGTFCGLALDEDNQGKLTSLPFSLPSFFLSQAEIEPGTFCGLALDEDNQGELTDGRVAAWTAQVLAEMKAKAAATA